MPSLHSINSITVGHQKPNRQTKKAFWRLNRKEESAFMSRGRLVKDVIQSKVPLRMILKSYIFTHRQPSRTTASDKLIKLVEHQGKKSIFKETETAVVRT